jgi:hypothetical protein
LWANTSANCKAARRGHAAPSFGTFGPKTDAEFEALLAERGGLPA